jgi:phospholipase D1/2
MDHIFVFNLRSYDRLNKTPALKKQEEISGVKYQDIQRAHAEEIMGSGLHPTKSERDEEPGKGKEASLPKDVSRADIFDQRQKFEERREEAGLGDTATSVDSIAKDAMLNGGKVSDEKWEGDPEAEKENFVQEELYIHAKLCIVDDRIVICGSSNLNDRVSQMYSS